MYTGRIELGCDTSVRVPLFLWSAWAQRLWWRADRQWRWSVQASVRLAVVGSVNVVAGTIGEGDVLDSFPLVGVGTVTVVMGRTGEGAALGCVPSFGVDQPANLLAVTKREGAALASVRWVGVCSASHCGGWNDR